MLSGIPDPTKVRCCSDIYVSQGCMFTCTYITNASCSESHSDICFPAGLRHTDLQLMMVQIYNVAIELCMMWLAIAIWFHLIIKKGSPTVAKFRTPSVQLFLKSLIAISKFWNPVWQVKSIASNHLKIRREDIRYVHIS